MVDGRKSKKTRRGTKKRGGYAKLSEAFGGAEDVKK